MKKYRFKTQEEFEATCKKDEDGDYICGKELFVVNEMSALFGQEYNPISDGIYHNLVKVGDEHWYAAPEMLVEL